MKKDRSVFKKSRSPEQNECEERENDILLLMQKEKKMIKKEAF